MLGDVLRALADRGRPALGLGDELPRLLFGLAPVLARVRLDREPDVARVVLRLLAHPGGAVAELLDAGLGLRGRAQPYALRLLLGLGADLLRSLLGRAEDAGDTVADPS